MPCFTEFPFELTLTTRFTSRNVRVLQQLAQH
jgi:hypothetical protein